MAQFQPGDTICALSTAPGTGAIAVIRLSGPGAFPIISSVFKPAEKGLELSAAPSHTLHFGHFRMEGSILDEVVIGCFRAPRSYTGEDVIEISCHGSVYIQQKIMELLVSGGARQARPGEFTFRAFLNGRFDLCQAEAVADLISAHSARAHDLALEQMRGGFSGKIKSLRRALVDFAALMELELDFSEEHMVFANRTDAENLLVTLEQELSGLIESFALGNVIKGGIPVAIIGRPNAGKSTLLNAILNEEKAIVSEHPGTTRDAIEDTIVIGGYSFRFIDTAGLRAAEDAIETAGIERTWTKIGEARIILYVFDVTAETFDEVRAATEEIMAGRDREAPDLVLIGNKTDLLAELPKGFREFVEFETIFVSGKRRENIHLLAEHLVDVVKRKQISDRTLVSSPRHHESLVRSLEAVRSVRAGLQSSVPPDLVAIDLRQALYHLGEITGEITTDEILGAVFSRFCIGK